ncbi:MAG: hypothetical protein COA96_10120 [SAR86 cluster bacterium]|uniref:Peptidase S74 domain-containing protein n=1 Tax=SAR86 cluster bacterium TaxID=2030880 RepID=A0A2A5AYB7_9GAMM|nr:MAG: hypothetical protein COA96_10120 [SAR86 cluster bacterium]
MGGFFGGSNAGASAAGAANRGIGQGIDELRNQFNATRQSFQPFIDVGQQALGGVQQASTVGGLGERLGAIFGGGALDPLIDERTRAAQGQLASTGLSRSGTALETIAGIPQELGLMIEQLLAGREQQLSGQGFQAVRDVGQFGANTAQGIAGSRTQQGQNISSGILADAQSDAAGFGNLINLASTAAFSFSDPRLKTNIVQVSSIGDVGVYQWDWIEAAKGTSIVDQPTVGFMADEVQEKYPEFVGELAGWMGIFYGPLLDKLEETFHINTREYA